MACDRCSQLEGTYILATTSTDRLRVRAKKWLSASSGSSVRNGQPVRPGLSVSSSSYLRVLLNTSRSGFRPRTVNEGWKCPPGTRLRPTTCDRGLHEIVRYNTASENFDVDQVSTTTFCREYNVLNRSASLSTNCVRNRDIK